MGSIARANVRASISSNSQWQWKAISMSSPTASRMLLNPVTLARISWLTTDG